VKPEKVLTAILVVAAIFLVFKFVLKLSWLLVALAVGIYIGYRIFGKEKPR